MQLVEISMALLCLRLVVGHHLGDEWDTEQGPIKSPDTVGKKIRKHPVPIPITVEIEKPDVIEKPVYEKVVIDKKVPVPFPVPYHYPVPIPKLKRVPIPRGYPSPVVVPVAKAVPIRIPFPVPIFVRIPVPAPLPVPKKVRVPVPVKTTFKFPVAIPIPVRVPVGVAKPFILGKETYNSPGWSALGLKDFSELVKLKGPQEPASWQAWAKSVPLKNLQDWSKYGNYGDGTSWDTEDFADLGDLKSISKNFNLDKFKGLDLDSFKSSIDEVFGKDLGSDLPLDDVKDSNDLKNGIVINKSSKISKSLETIVESPGKKIHLKSFSKTHKTD